MYIHKYIFYAIQSMARRAVLSNPWPSYSRLEPMLEVGAVQPFWHRRLQMMFLSKSQAAPWNLKTGT